MSSDSLSPTSWSVVMVGFHPGINKLQVCKNDAYNTYLLSFTLTSLNSLIISFQQACRLHIIVKMWLDLWKGSSTHIQFTNFGNLQLQIGKGYWLQLFGQQEASTSFNGWGKFQLSMPFDNEVMLFQVHKRGRLLLHANLVINRIFHFNLLFWYHIGMYLQPK